MALLADQWARIDFYVQAGLVPRRPTAPQLRQASQLMLANAGISNRLRHYLRHPLELLPTAQKRAALQRSNREVLAEGNSQEAIAAAKARPKARSGDRIDRTLETAFQFSPLRFAVQTAFNPWTAIPVVGLVVPSGYLIEHLAHSPHPSPLWDVQLLHPDPGGLERLEAAIAHAAHGRDAKARVYRALAQREGYYDYVLELADRCRRFDYPPTPPGNDPRMDNLVSWLNYAADL